MKPVTLSSQQSAFPAWIRDGHGSAFGEAVAGSGKTTTALMSLNETRGSVAVMAYNKSAAREFEKKATELGLNFGNRVRFGTVHSFGFGAWRYVHKNVKAGPEAARQKADDMLAALNVPKKLWGFVPKLIGLAKQRAIGLFGSVDDASLWYDIIDHFDLAHEIEEESQIAVGVDLAIRGLKWHVDCAQTIIDFDDMIYMPIVTGIRMWQNDWVVGDEWQDANPARRALARKMLKPGGRALFIGDRRQAIYGFTGADNDSIEQTIRDFKCIELPLTVTFRCPKAVVAKAQEVVSHIQAHESAPEGEVSYIDAKDIAAQDLQAHDAVLCRNTRPLIGLAYELIKKGIACHVEGRDIGANLLKLLNRFDDARTMEALRDRLDAYAERQCEKFIAKGRETQAEALLDRVETIKVISDNCKSLDELRQRITSMFVDGDNERKPTLTLSTVHKAKGREWNRVFILGREKFMPSPWARQQWQLEQEDNLIYVAYTRAKQQLVFASVEG